MSFSDLGSAESTKKQMPSDAPPVRWYGVMPNLKEAHALIRMADDVLHGLWLEKRDPYAARAKDLVQAVGDPARLTALHRDALVNVQYYHSRRPSSEQDEACPICLVDFNGESDEPLGRHNKRHRRRMHQRMQRLRRPHLQLDKDQIPALILRCRHLLHRHCWRTLRETVKADVIGRGLTCPLCRGPSDSVVPLDLVPDEQYIHFIWVAVATLRQLTPCSRVSSGEPSTRQSSCRYCHVVNGVLVQQGPPPAPMSSDEPPVRWYGVMPNLKEAHALIRMADDVLHGLWLEKRDPYAARAKDLGQAVGDPARLTALLRDALLNVQFYHSRRPSSEQDGACPICLVDITVLPHAVEVLSMTRGALLHMSSDEPPVRWYGVMPNLKEAHALIRMADDVLHGLWLEKRDPYAARAKDLIQAVGDPARLTALLRDALLNVQFYHSRRPSSEQDGACPICLVDITVLPHAVEVLSMTRGALLHMSSDEPPVRWYGVMPNLKEAHALIRMADDVLHGLWLEKRDPYAARAKDLIQAVGDPARLTALLRDALLNVQFYHSRRPSSEQDGACPICLVDITVLPHAVEVLSMTRGALLHMSSDEPPVRWYGVMPNIKEAHALIRMADDVLHGLWLEKRDPYAARAKDLIQAVGDPARLTALLRDALLNVQFYHSRRPSSEQDGACPICLMSSDEPPVRWYGMSSDEPPVRWYGVMPNLKEAHALIRMADDVLHGLWLEKRDPYAARAKDLVQAVGDPARLTALLRDALVNVQYYHSRRPSSEQDGACPICLVDFNVLHGLWLEKRDPYAARAKDLGQAVGDPARLTALLRDALLNVQFYHSRRPSSEQDGACPICLVDICAERL
ncbi:E3 ubiquitin-protein ligase [Frankliniella fusca]|uniref:E3 ubiquitin-protein ligase n=1 Tax=Frankliniella fusca TaxID=407009 RepID=A0AAE1GNU7_9NEOP|nr:E3 ubiquitin-protein ligase [Frankliniella fusca]